MTPRRLDGALNAQGMRLALVVGRFNSLYGERLAAGAVDCFLRHGGSEDSICTVHVPGSFEIPLTCLELARSGRFDAVVCVGALIRGETDHYRVIANELGRGVARVQLDTGVPVGFGVITADSADQAEARSGGKAGNLGYQATLAAIEMVGLMRQIRNVSHNKDG